MAHKVKDRTDYDTRDVGERVTRDIDVLQVGRLGVVCEPLDKDGQHFRAGKFMVICLRKATTSWLEMKNPTSAAL